MVSLLTRKRIAKQLHVVNTLIDDSPSAEIAGVITKISGTRIEATGLSVSLNTICKIIVSPHKIIHGQVIGFSGAITYLMAADYIEEIKPGSLVVPCFQRSVAHVGNALLGRIIDAEGKPIDERGELHTERTYSLYPMPINPLQRNKISEPLDVGVKAINALLTVGKGQRIGIFAASGLGKSVLLGMMTKFTSADVVVVSLIGERGREVKEFIEDNLGEDGLRKTVVVAAPADTSPLMRINGAILGTTIAEYYRDQGLDVLLIVDSLTRYAQSIREISLAVGELPTTRGFTPSVFAKLSQLVERAGNGCAGQGSITAFYTILIEGDDYIDPIGDHVRSILDGHIILSRHLADAGHYPAIDIEKSISRVMLSIIDETHHHYVNQFKRSYSAYAQNRELIQLGMYQSGTDAAIDEAIQVHNKLDAFLKQGLHEAVAYDEAKRLLFSIFVPNE